LNTRSIPMCHAAIGRTARMIGIVTDVGVDLLPVR
jgi:hypothetical protein